MADELDEFDYGFDEDEISTEDRARAMGWKPLNEFKGDQRRFVSAEEFVARGDAELPIMRDQNHRMSEKLVKFESEVGSLRNTVSEQAEAIRNAMDLARRADSAGYKRAMDELKAQQREAVSLGDTEAYDQIEERIVAAQAEREAGNVTVPIPKPAQPEMAPETLAFIAANPWFNEKAILRRAMIDAHQGVMAKHPEMPLAQQYEMAKAEVVDFFPQFFPKAAAPTPPEEEEEEEMVDIPRPRPRLRAQPLAPTAAANNGGTRQGRSPFDRIADPEDRAEAKAAFARIASYDPETTADEYVTLYLNPKTDILALRARRGRTIQ